MAGLPAVEAVAVVLHEEQQLVAAVGEAQFHRRGEAAQQRWQRLLRHLDEDEALLGLGHRQHAVAALGHGLAFQAQRKFVALAVEQTQPSGMTKGSLLGWPGVGGQLWRTVRV